MKCLKEKRKDSISLQSFELQMNGENKPKGMRKESSFKITKKESLMELLRVSKLKLLLTQWELCRTSLLDLSKNEELQRWSIWLNRIEEEEKQKNQVEDNLR